jgi:hypothetical protein
VPQFKVPEPFLNRNYVEQYLRENFDSFIDPPHWRLRSEDVAHVDVDLLRFQPPEYEVMFTILAKNMETFHFYEALVLKTRAEGMVRHEFTLEGQKLYLVSGFSSKEFVKGMLERWCRRERQDFIDFVGTFCAITGEADVEIKLLEPFFLPEEEPTSNYIYRCCGTATTNDVEKEFDVVIKKFVPRDPPDRGNREYGIAKALPARIVPRFHGGVINHAYSVMGEAQVLALFSDFIGGENIGKTFWELMLEIDDKKRKGEDYKTQLGKLHEISKNVVDGVIFPFHMSFRNLWYPFSFAVETSATNRAKYFDEVSKGLETLKGTGLLSEEEAEKLEFLFTEAWKRTLEKAGVAEIHNDLMWAQIMRSRDEELIVLDLDEHSPGHPAKDLADLCAANRFLAESVPCEDRDLMRRIADGINQTMIMRYRKNVQATGAEWGRGIEEALKIYLALRHLHDVAYHFPIWQATADPAVKKRHKRYIDFSLKLLRESIGVLEKMVPPPYKPPAPGNYLIEERVPKRAFKIFTEAVARGLPGLCISTSHPADLRREYAEIDRATILWLAKAELDYAVHPSNLGIVRDKILDFLSTNENAVVLLDGFEYLVTANGFDVALKFLHDLRETVVLRHARLFVPIAPEVFETKRLELLKRYLRVIGAAES